MDFSFTEEQREVSALARRILSERSTVESLRALEASEDRVDWALVKELGDAGLLGASLSADHGGSGLGFIEQCLVAQEIGRTVAGVPAWASTMLGAMPIDAFGNDEQRARWVAPAAKGDELLSAGFLEPMNPDPLRPQTSARLGAGEWKISGTKTRVPSASVATNILISAAIGEGGDEVGVFVVPRHTLGLAVSRQPLIDRGNDGYVVLDEVPVSPDHLLGTVTEGREIVDWTLQRATVGLCAMQLGVCEAALDRTAAYTQERKQFGRSTASFQAVGQRLADMYIYIEGIRLTWQQAAWRISEDLPARAEVATAKFWASDAGHRVVHSAVHLHGGVGIDFDYPLHRYYLAEKQIEFTLGNAVEQLTTLGDLLESSSEVAY